MLGQLKQPVWMLRLLQMDPRFTFLGQGFGMISEGAASLEQDFYAQHCMHGTAHNPIGAGCPLKRWVDSNSAVPPFLQGSWAASRPHALKTVRKTTGLPGYCQAMKLVGLIHPLGSNATQVGSNIPKQGIPNSLLIMKPAHTTTTSCWTQKHP